MPRSNRRRAVRSAPSNSGQIRLIAGRWRGRLLPVIDAPGLRPTGDRLRETLFNWLQQDLPGARCLDLFAGSGALGFEAASRGAAHVDLIEASDVAARQLETQRRLLGADESVVVHHQTAESWLALSTIRYNIVFIDPPFDLDCQLAMLEQIRDADCLAGQARVYVESPVRLAMPDELPGYELHRSVRYGDVAAWLYTVTDEAGVTIQ